MRTTQHSIARPQKIALAGRAGTQQNEMWETACFEIQGFEPVTGANGEVYDLVDTSTNNPLEILINLETME